MISFLKNFFRLLKLFYIINKNQIFLSQTVLKVPFCLRVLVRVFGFLFCPQTIFIRPKHSFGERLAKSFVELGPIYIKLGQTLSTRPDLIGNEVANNLKFLQDKLPAFDSNIVRSRIENSFGKNISEIFDYFEEEPVAAASIAQVHKARLKSGEIVAIKILRPEITKKYKNDMELLEYCATFLSFFLGKGHRFKPKEAINVFKKSMERELNLRLEASAASRFADNFASDETLFIPKIYWHLTTSDIITLEWIDGVSIYDKDKIIKMGLDPKNIAEKIAIIFLNQAYRDGFFHADMHPGNILVCPNGKVALIDFGIIGTLNQSDRLAIAEMLYAFLKRDYHRVAKIHERIGYIPPNTNLEHFAQSCRAVAEPIIGCAVKDISIGKLLAQLFEVTKEFGMKPQTHLLLLQKTMLVVEGIGHSLDSEINMWHLAQPWIKKWAAKNLSPEAKILRFIKKQLGELL